MEVRNCEVGDQTFDNLYNLYKLVQRLLHRFKSKSGLTVFPTSARAFPATFATAVSLDSFPSPADNRDPQGRGPAPDGALRGTRGLTSPGGNASSHAVMTAETVAGHLVQIEMEVNRMQRAIRITIQNQLARLAGCSLGSVESNRELAAAIHQMLDSHGLRVRCPECGHPAILRVSPRSGAKQGAFVYDHTIDGRRTFHGGRGTVPEIHLVAKPKRQKSAPKIAGEPPDTATKDGATADDATKNGATKSPGNRRARPPK